MAARTTRAQYPADGGADHDFGGRVTAQASGGLAVLVSMPVGAYQACYYKYTPVSTLGRRLSVVFNVWTTVAANLGVTPRDSGGDPFTTDSPPPLPPPPSSPSPAPPPFQYFVMDACGGTSAAGTGLYMRNPVCLDVTETRVPADLLPVDSTTSDGAGGFRPWREYDSSKIVVRCCGYPPDGAGKTCRSREGGSCYVGDAGTDGGSGGMNGGDGGL